MSQSITWVQFKILPKDNYRREIDTAGEGSASPSGMPCMGTTVWTHPTSSCSCLAVPQMQIIQWQHSQGSMHHVWGLGQAAVQATVGEGVPWWHWQSHQRGMKEVPHISPWRWHGWWQHQPPTKKWMRCKTIVSPCHLFIYKWGKKPL